MFVTRCTLLILQLVLLTGLVQSQREGSFRTPATCSGQTCDYQVTWTLDVPTDVITFVIIARQTINRWTAIGFSSNPQMENQDTIYGFIAADLTSAVMVDGWVGPLHTNPQPDVIQNLLAPSISYANGFLTFTFSRLRNTGDSAQDAIFTNTGCFYFKYPVFGGTYTGTTINYHDETPLISSTPICITP